MPAFLATQHTTMCLDLSALLQFAVSTDYSIIIILLLLLLLLRPHHIQPPT